MKTGKVGQLGRFGVGISLLGAVIFSASLRGQAVMIDYADGEDRMDPIVLGMDGAELRVDNGSAMQSGVISGAGLVTKLGEGELTFSAINSYSGGTLVQEGELELVGTISHPVDDLVVSGAFCGCTNLTLMPGALLDVRSVLLGIGLNDVGGVLAEGGEWQTAERVTVGVEGAGEVFVLAPTDLESQDLILADEFLSSGLVVMQSGLWTVRSDFVIGDGGYAEFLISEDAHLVADTSTLGMDSDGTGLATMEGGTWESDSTLTIGFEGVGVIELGGGTITAPSIDLAMDCCSDGQLVIGFDDRAGVVNSSEVFGGPGLAQLFFNHAETDYFFTNTGTGSGDAISMTGNLLVIHEGSGTTTLTGPSTFDQGVFVENGVLVLSNSTGSATGIGPVVIVPGATLAGSGRAGGSVTLESGGTIAVPSSGSLRVGSLDWDGGGRLAISLQSEPASTGKLIVQGALTAGEPGPLQIQLGGTASAGQTYVLAEFGTNNVPLSRFQVAGAQGRLTTSDGQLRFTASGSAPRDNSSPRIRVRRSKRNPLMTFVVTNPGSESATFRLRAGAQRTGDGSQGGGGQDDRRIRRIFTLNGKNVTNRISFRTGPGVNTPVLAPGQSARVGFRIRTVRNFATKRRIEARLSAFNVREPQKSATKRGQIIVRPNS